MQHILQRDPMIRLTNTTIAWTQPPARPRSPRDMPTIIVNRLQVDWIAASADEASGSSRTQSSGLPTRFPPPPPPPPPPEPVQGLFHAVQPRSEPRPLPLGAAVALLAHAKPRRRLRPATRGRVTEQPNPPPARPGHPAMRDHHVAPDDRPVLEAVARCRRDQPDVVEPGVTIDDEVRVGRLLVLAHPGLHDRSAGEAGEAAARGTPGQADRLGDRRSARRPVGSKAGPVRSGASFMPRPSTAGSPRTRPPNPPSRAATRPRTARRRPGARRTGRPAS